jgi:hypothetical protein
MKNQISSFKTHLRVNKSLLIALIFSISWIAAAAQNITVKGTIFDNETGEGLEGVTIQDKA